MTTALVTGASAGIGAEFCWQLARAGTDLVMVARNRERLDELATGIRATTGVTVEVLVADLAERADVERVAVRLAEGDRPVGMLVNNAGFGLNSAFLDSDLARQDGSLEVMVRTVMALSHAAGKAMVARGEGAIINISSLAALMAYGTYSAHKAWVVAFTEGLSQELRGTGVTATVVRPGLVHTEFQERAGMELAQSTPFLWLEADQVVKASLRGARRGRVIVTPSLRYLFALGIVRLLPRWLVRRLTARRK